MLTNKGYQYRTCWDIYFGVGQPSHTKSDKDGILSYYLALKASKFNSGKHNLRVRLVRCVLGK